MFTLNLNTQITAPGASIPVANAVKILERDIKKAFSPTNEAGGRIALVCDNSLGAEEYVIDIYNEIIIKAADDLGFIYGLLRISSDFLGIKPFWFWMDQQIPKRARVQIEPTILYSPKTIIKYRGWFVNDEVLLMQWRINGDAVEPWRMVFEALLRCGGNMVIPGTDKDSKIFRGLASDMGLWITHHHAEPLGAEMFTRAYHGIEPNYDEHPEKFIRLWEDAVKAQKDMKVVWALGFRGQGDCPFWASDSSGKYDTSEKRGALISSLIEKQRQIVLKYVDNPVLCTNLYGEISELYDAGHIHLADDIIKISADNGYGKMVVRRRDNHSPRISSMPKVREEHAGIYYHVSFYDLQAANHITRLPNSVEFVNRELDEVIAKNAVDYWIINCSNVRPHVYYLDALRKKWYGGDISDSTQSREFAEEYFAGSTVAAECLAEYPSCTIQYGSCEDEHAGEQLLNENIRAIATHVIRGKDTTLGTMHWLTSDVPLLEQVQCFEKIVASSCEKMRAHYEKCLAVYDTMTDAKDVFGATVLLQAKIYHYSIEGALKFFTGFYAMHEKRYMEAFMAFGESADYYTAADAAMHCSEYGVWSGFYFNECLADVKHTAYVVKKLMGYVRELGDNIRHDEWYRLAVYAPEDRDIYTLLINDNHMTDEELYTALKCAAERGEILCK